MLQTSLIIIECIILFLVIPTLAGRGCLRLINRKNISQKSSVADSLIYGYMLIWAFVEIIAIPVTIMKKNFNILVVTVSVICILFAIAGIVPGFSKNGNKEKKGKGKGMLRDALVSVFRTKEDIVFFVLFILGFIYVVYRIETTLFYDEDDSRFLVNAVDIVRTKRILAVNPVNGNPLTTNYDDFAKDLVGQWAAFLAFGSVVSGVQVTVWAHMIYPVISLILLMVIYWKLMDMISETKEVKDKSITIKNRFSTADKSLMGLIVLALYCFGHISKHYAETFSLRRVWQGKGTLAGVGILLIIYCFMQIAHDEKNWGGYIMLLLANLSICLMTSMGTIIAVIMIFSYGVVMAIYKKSLRVLILSALLCLPDILLYVLSEKYTLEMFLK